MQAESSANLFRTDADLVRDAARAVKHAGSKDVGAPISLASKPLALLVDGDDGWVAESGFVVRRLDLRTGKTIRLFKGHSGPVTSLALWTPPSVLGRSARSPLLFSGSWDKTVRISDTETGELVAVLAAHADFVKTILIVSHPTRPVLLTGSSDKTLKVHLLAPLLARDDDRGGLSGSPETVQTLKVHTRPITTLALAPPPMTGGGPVEVLSGDSMGRVIVWAVDEKEGSVELREVRRLKDAQTSVTALNVCDDGVWTASMDLSTTFHPSPAQGRPASSLPSLPLPAGLPSSSLAPLSLLTLTDARPPLLIVGHADESLRLYSLEEGEGAEARLLRVQEGHEGEVSALAAWERDGESWIVSASLDRTLRRWKVADLLHPPTPKLEESTQTAMESGSGLTAEEERELAELMGSDDDD